MKRISVFILIVITAVAVNLPAHAQLINRAEHLIQAVFGDSGADSSSGATEEISIKEQHVRDSVRLIEMARKVREMELNEMNLRSELHDVRLGRNTADSIRLAEQRAYIDSLRATTAGIPVTIDGDTLFTLYAGRGGYSAADRAEMTAAMLQRIAGETALQRDSVYILENENYIDIMYSNKVLISITDQDALWEGTSRHNLAAQYSRILSEKIEDLKADHNFMQILKRVALFILVIVVQYLLFKLTIYLFRRLRRQIIRFKQQRLKPVIIRDYELFNTRQLCRMLIFLSNIIRYLVLFIQLTVSVPILFAIFPQTERLALNIFHYILEPIKMVFRAVVDYIPNLFIVLVIWLCIRYIIKGVRYIAKEIENEKLKISGFYPDWARPSFNIIRFLLYAFMIAMIYPYLPGSNSGVFQGISVFVGLIVSLGSSTVIGNIIAGLVITYMRPFKIGDRIKLDDTTGNVIEKTPFVTRLRTPKNEVVTIPNSFIMSSHTVNYSSSARQFGLIIHTTVTIGYDAPWRQVHQLLINAARITPGVLDHPKPFVLETGLEDYYPCYQINAYIKDADHYGDIMSALHQNIQDIFNEAGVEIMSPHYYAGRDGSATTIPTDDLRPKE